jgi:hypothetical protein
MATALRVEAAVPGRKRAGTREHPVEIALDTGPVPLRQLIDAVVRAEVAAFRRRAEEQTFVRVLTEQALAEGVAAGAVRSGDREVAADVDDDEAVAAALVAFQDGIYQVIVDDEPMDDLDATIALGSGTRLLFLRLVPLAGG